MTDEHPARAMSRRSMAAVEAGDKEAWLALFAEDGVVEDPIGPSPFDPEGKGHHGKEGIGAFFDSTIAPNQVRFSIAASYACGLEVANVGTITTTLPDGSKAIVDGVFTYRVNEAGELAALRAYWELDGLGFEAAPS